MGGLQGSQGCLGRHRHCLGLLSSLCGRCWCLSHLPQPKGPLFLTLNPGPVPVPLETALPSSAAYEGCLPRKARAKLEWRPTPPSFSMPPWGVHPGDTFLNTCTLAHLPSPARFGFGSPTLGHSFPKLGWLGHFQGLKKKKKEAKSASPWVLGKRDP